LTKERIVGIDVCDKNCVDDFSFTFSVLFLADSSFFFVGLKDGFRSGELEAKFFGSLRD